MASPVAPDFKIYLTMPLSRINKLNTSIVELKKKVDNFAKNFTEIATCKTEREDLTNNLTGRIQTVFGKNKEWIESGLFQNLNAKRVPKNKDLEEQLNNIEELLRDFFSTYPREIDRLKSQIALIVAQIKEIKEILEQEQGLPFNKKEMDDRINGLNERVKEQLKNYTSLIEVHQNLALTLKESYQTDCQRLAQAIQLIERAHICLKVASFFKQALILSLFVFTAFVVLNQRRQFPSKISLDFPFKNPLLTTIVKGFLTALTPVLFFSDEIITLSTLNKCQKIFTKHLYLYKNIFNLSN